MKVSLKYRLAVLPAVVDVPFKNNVQLAAAVWNIGVNVKLTTPEAYVALPGPAKLTFIDLGWVTVNVKFLTEVVRLV